LCVSEESYFTIRNQFIRSFATLQLCSYILGIGDRHLENFLVDVATGDAIAIDFGHAFGSATELLRYPELVPFRLTRQITSLIEPLWFSPQQNINSNSSSDSLISYTMVHVLEALRSQKNLILTTMEIFLKEPLMDWLKEASKYGSRSKDFVSIIANNSSNNKSGDVNNVAVNEEPSTVVIEDEELPPEVWYPQAKVNMVKKKLELANPVEILCEELKNNAHLLHRATPSKQPYAAAVERVVRGDSLFGTRYTLKADNSLSCQDVNHQVNILIELATDPNILSRQYIGWAAMV